jgi:hypothetical protein
MRAEKMRDVSRESGSGGQVRLTGATFTSVENWRRQQGKIPSRADAVSQLLQRAFSEPPGDERDALDSYRREQENPPSRAQAAREIIRSALRGHASGSADNRVPSVNRHANQSGCNSARSGAGP